MITLIAPNTTPPDRITLRSGATVFPRDGIVKVFDEEEAGELERMGWRRDAASAKAAEFNADMLRKAAAAQMGRMPGVGDFETTSRDNSMTLAEFNVRIGPERVRVKRGEKAIIVAGIEVPL